MREVHGDLWEVAEELKADAIVITTNGFVKKNGEAVMGRGVALEARERFPALPEVLGRMIRNHGNVVHNLGFIFLGDPPLRIGLRLFAYPVKTTWRDWGSLLLIRVGALELKHQADSLGMEVVVLPRPGCGNGQRDWETQVKPLIAPILDDRFVVVNNQ